ncbi:hypothetical protein NQ314_011092 [Rhamnusium bicolor]|uniref:AMP-binding enzyme C-terminal domain-containing protein n=1 Tax=Rhamnusium bicolor TaxID=1586634 RepID=A0AAV8XKL1_9CUCU|nr:hypothetical protein NQ314_011092 [Rhamnusium bicolor]
MGVVDLDTEEVLGPNQEGELRVKTDRIMNGYYNQDCQDQFDEEGWFKTGDIVKYDENCCLFVVDRVKELIKYTSTSVQPANIERELLKHPSVKQAVVIGKPHETDGEHPMAIIILNENYKDTTPEEIQKYIEERLLYKEKLRGGVIFVDSMPMSTSDKVKRRQLKNIILGRKLE